MARIVDVGAMILHTGTHSGIESLGLGWSGFAGSLVALMVRHCFLDCAPRLGPGKANSYTVFHPVKCWPTFMSSAR